MKKIRNIVFDFGGVIIELNREQAVERFVEIGVKNADSLIDKYHQKGVFLEVEDGRISAEEFCCKLSEICGKRLSYKEVQHGWLGFVKDTPQYKLDYIASLREKYKVHLLSNTNPFVMNWARSTEFTSAGKPLDAYFDRIYASYEVGVVKPERRIFDYMIADTQLVPTETLFVDDGEANIKIAQELGFQTFQPLDGEDWRNELNALLQAI